MADTTTTAQAPKRRGRKPNAEKTAAKTSAPKTATPSKTKSTAPRAKANASAPAATPSFAESIQLASAAVSSAKKTARAKVDSATATAKSKVQSAKESASAFDWKGQAEDIKAQATKMARETATTAKSKTSTAMDGLAKLITETAQTVDSKLGPQYGDYARQAANAVAGAAKTLDDKDVDQLLGEARDFVRKSPAVAIGAAAIAGYVLMRLARGSSDED